MCDESHAAGFGTKKQGMPWLTVVRFADKLGRPLKKRIRSLLAPCSKRDQNSRNRGMRLGLAFPAIKPALIAPIDVPMTQSGSTPASCIASYTPTWYAPSAPPPCKTSTTCPGNPGLPPTFVLPSPAELRRFLVVAIEGSLSAVAGVAALLTVRSTRRRWE